MTPICSICGCEIPNDELAWDYGDVHKDCLQDNPVMSPYDLDYEDEEEKLKWRK